MIGGRTVITLRPGGIEDVPKVGACMRAAFDPIYGEAWTDSQLSAQLVGPAASLTIAAIAGRLAGFSLVRRILDEAELLLIATCPEQRGSGVGTALLDAAIDDMRAAGSRALFLEVRRNNPAERLYGARGFRQVGERPGYYRGAGGLVSDARTYRLDLG